ncbi:MAG: hypothetical protein HQK49_19765 [Oligoflexia bacterium]|nr:hypothetical protein [Oligoflexia bacterium]
MNGIFPFDLISNSTFSTLNSTSNFKTLIFLLSNSLVCGFLLAITTFYMSKWLAEDKNSSDSYVNEKENVNENVNLLLGSANILFLCVGLTAVMILVNNNLARAFAIGAALAITRFRVKVGPKILASNLLFGVIVGVAIGLSEITLAWLLTIIYIFLKIILLFLAKRCFKN